MFYWLSGFSDAFGPLNVLRYITFRTGGAMMTALIFVFLFGRTIINWLRRLQGKGQPIREPMGRTRTSCTKSGTPTMGGLMILFGIVSGTLLWGNLTNSYVWIVLGVTLSFGAIGFYDDYLKVTKQTSCGRRRAKLRLGLEILIAAAACYAFMTLGSQPFATLAHLSVLQGDGAAARLVLHRVRRLHHRRSRQRGEPDRRPRRPRDRAGDHRRVELRHHLLPRRQRLLRRLTCNIHYVPGTGELAVLCGAVIGAGLGFLWFNAPPASIFMGDTGSLALGGMLGAIAVATKHEIVLAVIGGLFVLEAVSVIVQVISFKLTGKRVFRMAPIHHHFEQLGWTEPQIVIRFWIIAVVLALVGPLDAEAAVMIPVTHLRRQEGRRVRARRLGAGERQCALGRRRRRHRLGRQRRDRGAGDGGRHPDRRSARHRLVARLLRWCSRPACR